MGASEQGLTDLEIRKLVYGYIGVDGGYLGDFTYVSHREFYIRLGLAINPDIYPPPTRERFIAVLRASPPAVQARILEGILERYQVDSSQYRSQALHGEIKTWIARLQGGGAVAPPSPPNVSDVVVAALADAEALVQNRGAMSAVDRVHTALHGYLRDICGESGIQHDPGDSVTALYKRIRTAHPRLQGLGAHRDEILKILASLSATIDALNTIRNDASMAHPNEELLDEAEAMLAINGARTVFHYLEQKLRQP